ncbi:MAG TPA: tRNA (adenosine(37)-N6)-threonylcarbamoyltransferase complex transferase subunit TsaD [Vicinamibacterales bacterium]|nr:tRNA (adenosine(37)-N6)-threonylcarbamoyltransferase complex transferase subunit TsaD [Vicinamibacterales bacterium]
MKILAIESSCDETAAAVVEEVDDLTRPWIIRSNVVASQVAIHREWGGVVPELASRQHVRDICGVVEQALADARLALRDLDALAVTQGPGLVGSLLVGLSFAKALAVSLDLPLVPVHHLAGHIESLFLHNGPLPLPAVVLVVSGGHTSLYLVPQPGEYRPIGRTRDDAAGEAYDKVAKLLGLGYPGGPIIDKLARQGNDRAVDFPTTRITHRDRNAPELAGRFDFSFSGIKTAVLRHVRARTDVGGRGAEGAPGAPGGFTEAEIADICASFQRTVVEVLVDRLFDAAWRHGAKSVGIAGGVSANSRLRQDALARGEQLGLPVYLPTLALSTDNAAMIAAAGLRGYHRGVRAGLDLNADAALTLA